MRDVVRRAMTKAPATLNALTMADPLGNPKRPIRWRVFVAGSVALLAAPWVADGQERNPPRIGALLLTSNPENFQRQFGQALQELGYAQGRNIAIEYRSAAAGEVDHLAELAGELVRLRSDIIVAQNTPAAQAAKRATADIPIVIMAGDPVGTGLVSPAGMSPGYLPSPQNSEESFSNCYENSSLLRTNLRPWRTLRTHSPGRSSSKFSRPRGMLECGFNLSWFAALKNSEKRSHQWSESGATLWSSSPS